jgi:predicted XRE-type DNA-binding protein
MARKSTTAVREKSTDNVFADLGMPHAEEELVKACLTLQIYGSIKSRYLTPAQAGETLGLKHAQVSRLMRHRSGNVSVERLMDFLTALGHDVEVRVTPTRKEHGQLSSVVAVLAHGGPPSIAHALSLSKGWRASLRKRPACTSPPLAPAR